MELKYIYWWIATGIISNILNYILKLTFTEAFEDLESKNRFILFTLFFTTLISSILGAYDFIIFINSLFKSVFKQNEYRQKLIKDMKEANEIYLKLESYFK